MTITEMLEKQNMTRYRLSKESGVPYATLSDICSGKTKISQCSAETVYRLAKVLSVAMEDLLKETVETRSDFEIFKSNVCHRIKDVTGIDFIIDTIKADTIRKYWNKQWYPEAFYLLAALDYLSRINEIPLCNQYDDIRSHSLKEPLYPRDVQMESKLFGSSERLEKCRVAAIPEFARFNIMESEIENVY